MAYSSEGQRCDSHDFQYFTWHGPMYTNTYTNTNTYSDAYTNTNTYNQSNETHYNTWHGLNWLKHKRHPRHRYLYSQDGLFRQFPPTRSPFNSPSVSHGEDHSEVEGHGETQGQVEASREHGGGQTRHDNMGKEQSSLATAGKTFHQRGDVPPGSVSKKEELKPKANRSISGRSSSGLIAVTAAMFCCWMPNDDDLR